MIIASLPRSASYLAAQLVEEYLIRRYPLSTKRLPFYEMFCVGNICRTKNIAMHPNLSISEVDKIDFEAECRNRIRILHEQRLAGYECVFKLMYNVNPRFVNDHYEAISMPALYITRDPAEAMMSRIVASIRNEWHTFKDDSQRFELFAKNSYTDHRTVRPKENLVPRTVKRERIDKLVNVQKQFNEHMDNRFDLRPNITYKIDYAEFVNDYPAIYEALGFKDWAQYITDFDFVKTVPCEEEFNELILNHEEIREAFATLP